MTSLSTQNYKGARDFYPEDMRLQNYIFQVWRRVSERYGYEEYQAPLIELTDLYRAKTGEEIVNEQTYSFIDRGGRDVTLRPEMTPTLARMVAARQQELSYPLRWYSIPNLWRYERPQHGRLREHWQLNVDIVGLGGIEAEVELIRLGHALMHEFGADDDMFTIKLNSRELMSYLFGEYLELSVAAAHSLSKLLDRKNKISQEAFINQADAILKDRLSDFLELLKSTRLQDLPESLRDSEPALKLRALAQRLHGLGVSNIHFDLTVQRGFDYYTGIVFEFFDTHSDNPRSLFGGGRYDDLMSIFKAQRLPAAGFGTGDVITADFLRSHGLVPDFVSTTTLYLGTVGEEVAAEAENLADKLRSAGINVAVDCGSAKIGTKIKIANKKGVPYFMALGQKEVEAGKYALKALESGTVIEGSLDAIVDELKHV